MRICMLLGKAYPPDIRVEKEVAALADAGHEVFVLSLPAQDRPAREQLENAEVIRRPIRDVHNGVTGRIRGLRYLTTYVHQGWFRAGCEVIESADIDVLHVHDLPPVKTAIRLGEQYGIPVVADLHENWPEAKQFYRKGSFRQNLTSPRLIFARLLKSPRRLRRFEQYSVRNADRVITPVEEGRQHYIRDCGADPDAVRVISNVVDLRAFDEADITPLGDDDEFVISYVGTFTGEHRGLDTVIEALPAVADTVPDARLVIVGPKSRYGRTLERLCVELGVADRVEFPGRVPFGEVPSYLAASDVCLVPHRDNAHTATTVPHKLFQYMAMCKPVVVTDVGPLGRIVRETDAGLVVSPSDADTMAGSLVNIATNPERAARLGENGRTAVEERYNWEVEAEKLRDLYQGLPA